MYLHLLLTFASFVVSRVYAQMPSPCPEIFTYESKSEENQDRWYGTISLRTAEELEGVWLKVILDRPADLLGNWFGEISSNDNIEFTIKNAKYRLEAGPSVSVRFFVKYNTAKTVPSLKAIRLNGKVVCSTKGDEVSRPTPPTLHISKVTPGSGEVAAERPSRPGPSSGTGGGRRPGTSPSGGSNRPSVTHETRPGGASFNREPEPTRKTSRPSNNYESEEDDDDRPISYGTQRPGNVPLGAAGEEPDFFQGDFASIALSQKPTSRPVLVYNQQSSCGTVAAAPVPLISHGQSTFKGQWPWHVALYHSQGIQVMYICGGTLISERYVITAAHCVTKPHTNRLVNKKYILLYLGKHELRSFGPEVQDRTLEEIHVHPEYDHTVYFNDIAVLKLNQPVQITKYVRPCCLWEEDTELDYIEGKFGTVVGWGYDENLQLSNTLMRADMPVISTVKCIYQNRDFFSQFTFEKNYCAGFSNGTSVCNGDSGSGMVFPKKNRQGQDPVWQLRGLVSVGVALQGRAVCNTTQPSIFTDVAKHLSWIRQIINS